MIPSQPRAVDIPLATGLASLGERYRALVCDIWGVVHNGAAAHPAACEALIRFRRGGGVVTLLTNAPRLPDDVVVQMRTLGAPDGIFDAIVTSGALTRELLLARGITAVHHIGPDRDLGLYEGTPIGLVGPEAAEVVVCTGLHDDTVETPEDYRSRLEACLARGLMMICANPDIVVERGGDLIWCAGAVARLYQDLGGAVHQVGKPFQPAYAAALAAIAAAGGPTDRRAVLAVGDALATDMRGAADHAIDALFVIGGIHQEEFGPRERPDPHLISARFASEGLSAVAAMPALVW